MNKKLIVCFIIFVLFICTFSINSFATYNLTLGDLNLSLPDEAENYAYKLFIYRIWNTGINGAYRFDYHFYFSDSEITCTDYRDGLYIYSDTPLYLDAALTSVSLPAPYNFSIPTLYSASYDSSKSYYYNYFFAVGTVSVYDDSVSVYSNFDLKNRNTGNVVFNSNGFEPPFENPSFITTEDELLSGDFDYLQIDAGGFDYADDVFYFNIYDGIPISNDLYDYVPKKSFRLNSYSDYMHANDLQITYHIPKEKLGISFDTGNRYLFQLSDSTGSSGTSYNQIAFTVSERPNDEIIKDNQDVTNDKLDEQTNAIKESNETNKGIWETIKDILSYINPFSENFFVYKLIELLVNALKSLFIPSSDFLSTYFTDLKNWFSDRLGFLFYPFELIIDVLNKMVNIDFSNPVFNIPNISEPFTGQKLISAATYNLNSILDSEAFKTIHDMFWLD